MEKKKNQVSLKDAIDNYYNYNPDTLMPLLMLVLAIKGKLFSTTYHKKNAIVLYEIKPSEVMAFDWVRQDSLLHHRVKEAIKTNTIRIEGLIDDSLKDIYETFYHYDTYTVDEEYHHRIGLLYHHSSNRAYEQAHRQYAAIYLAETILETPKERLIKDYLRISNIILEKSGLQPKRPRLKVANVLKDLLQYDGIGKVYNPFAGCAIAAAAINAGANMYADGNSNDKLFAVARLLNYGMGGSVIHYAQRNSEKWTDQGQFEYVVSTYLGYINGKTAFDFCLSHCFNTLTKGGKYAGIITPKDIFERQSCEFKEALRRDWVDAIVLLPFGEVAVLINTNKDILFKRKVRFLNFNHPLLKMKLLSRKPVNELLANDKVVQILKVSDVKKKGFLRSLIIPNIEPMAGYEMIKMSDLVCKKRKFKYSLDRIDPFYRVMAYIDRNVKYNNNGLDYDVKKTGITSLFAPAYHITKPSLITNDKGALEPRFYDALDGSAYFQDGYVFELKSGVDAFWLIEELNKVYVRRQLHPYGMDDMLPEAMTEEQILNLKIYREIETQPQAKDDSLPGGFELTGKNGSVYTIHRFLGSGCFGYAYTASAKSRITGEKKEVVLKEFFPHQFYSRDLNDYKVLEYEDCSTDCNIEKNKFREEAKIMHKLGNTPDSHIVKAEELFESEKTNTIYYVMPFYQSGSLLDMQQAGTIFTEELLINNILLPLCKALNLAHKSRVLHLDIKPDNILVDDLGEALLTDFGVAKQYDQDGAITNREGVYGTSRFAAPEIRNAQSGSAMVKFGSEPDIFSLSATLFNLATKEYAHPIQYNSDDDTDLRDSMRELHLSEQFIDAIISGLQAAAPSRPKNAQEFLNLFPGCETIVL